MDGHKRDGCRATTGTAWTDGATVDKITTQTARKMSKNLQEKRQQNIYTNMCKNYVKTVDILYIYVYNVFTYTNMCKIITGRWKT